MDTENDILQIHYSDCIKVNGECSCPLENQCRARKINGCGITFCCEFSVSHSGLHSFEMRKPPTSITILVAALRTTAAKSKGGHSYWMTELADELERT